GQIAGLSCFIVEQYLSPWMDGEIEDGQLRESLKAHLSACSDCHNRLEEYRQLQSRVLAERRSFEPIKEEEWQWGISDLKRRHRKRLVKVSAFLMMVMVVAGTVTWALNARTKKM